MQPDGWCRLSRRMLLIHPVQEGVRAVPAVVAVLFSGGSAHAIATTVGLVVVFVLFGLLRWFTTRYRVSADAVQVRRGLLRRREATSRLDRVRTVDVTAPIMHRLLGLSRVVIGTGTNDRRRGDRGLILDGLTAAEAARLRAQLLPAGFATPHPGPAAHVEYGIGHGSGHGSGHGIGQGIGYGSGHGTGHGVKGRIGAGGAPGGAPEQELLRLDAAWCRYAPFTLSGVVTGVGLVLLGFQFFQRSSVDPSRLAISRAVRRHYRSTPVWLDTVQGIVAVVIVVSVLAVLGYLTGYWRLRLTRQPDGALHLTRGLITTRATTIDGSRIRGVELAQPVLLSSVGGAACAVIATGLHTGRRETTAATTIVPPAPAMVVGEAAARVLGTQVPLVCDLVQHPAAARRRRFVRAVGPALLLSAAVVTAAIEGALPPWPALVALGVPLGGLLALDRARSLGHAVALGYLVVRSGSLRRRRAVLAGEAVIGWTVRSSLFQRRAGLVTLIATTAAGRQAYRLPDVSPVQARAVITELTPQLRVVLG